MSHKTASITMRLDPAFDEVIRKLAKANGRSLAAEIKFRLERDISQENKAQNLAMRLLSNHKTSDQCGDEYWRQQKEAA